MVRFGAIKFPAHRPILQATVHCPGAGPLRRVQDFPGGAERIVTEAIGVDAVIVNGALLRRNNADVCGDRLPGRLLRGGRAAASRRVG